MTSVITSNDPDTMTGIEMMTANTISNDQAGLDWIQNHFAESRSKT
jgi:hypothetical protein